MKSLLVTTIKRSKLTNFISKTLTLMFILQFQVVHNEDNFFNGTVKSFSFQVKATPSGGMVIPQPPSSSIEKSGGKVEHEVKDGLFIVPPYFDNVIALVEASNSKLDVRGEYSKWKPKIIKMKPRKKLIKVVHTHAPKILPLKKIFQNRKLQKSNSHILLTRPSRLTENHIPYWFPWKRMALSNAPVRSRRGISRLKSDKLDLQNQEIRVRNTKESGEFLAKNYDQKRALRNSDFELLHKSYFRPNQMSSFKRIPRRVVRKKVDARKKEAKRSVSENNVKMSDQIADMISESIKRTKQKKSKVNNVESDEKDDDERIKEAKNTVMKSKKNLLGSKEMTGYIDGVKSKVNHVLSEAKEVLQNTGKIVHGLRNVVNGAKKLTDFTNNAVKFAKYFAMQPDNATVDFFEEKAVIAVLEAQKAAAEAKIAAVIARDAAKRAQNIVKKFDKEKKRKLGKKLGKAVKYVNMMARKAEESAKITSSKENEAKNDAVVVDKALRKMVELSNKKEEKKENAEEGNFETEEDEKRKKEGTDEEQEKNQENERKEEKTIEKEINGKMTEFSNREKNFQIEQEEKRKTGTSKEHEKKKQDENKEEKIAEKEMKRKLVELWNKKEVGKKENAKKEDAEAEEEEKRKEERTNEEHEKNEEDKIEEEQMKGIANITGNGSSKKIKHSQNASDKEKNDEIAEDDIKSLYENVKTSIDNLEITKTKGLEASELPELFDGGADQNEVISNDFEIPSFQDVALSASHLENNENITKGSKNAFDKLTGINVRGKKGVKQKSDDVNTHHDTETLFFNDKFKNVPVLHNKKEQMKKRPVSEVVVETVQKTMRKGPVNLIVTVNRKRVENNSKTLNTSSSENESRPDSLSYDPFHFQSETSSKTLNSAKKPINSVDSWGIVDKEDTNRIGISRNFEKEEGEKHENYKQMEEEKSTVANKKEFDQKSKDFNTYRSIKKSLIPRPSPFLLKPYSNYVGLDEPQRSDIPWPAMKRTNYVGLDEPQRSDIPWPAMKRTNYIGLDEPQRSDIAWPAMKRTNYVGLDEPQRSDIPVSVVKNINYARLNEPNRSTFPVLAMQQHEN